MNLSLRHYKNLLGIIAVGLFVLFGGLYILHHAPGNRQSVVANALLADMLLTFPVAFYLIVIRPLKLRKAAMLLVFSGCCLVAYFVLPTEQKGYILQVRKLTMLIELLVVGYAITKTRQIVRVYKAKQAIFPDAAYHLKESFTNVLGSHRAVKVLASELVVLRYSLFVFRKEKVLAQPHQQFTVYRDSGYIALFCILVFVSLVEITGMHLLIARHHQTAALWITLFNIYGCFILVADISAIVKRPVIIAENKIHLRVGMRWKVDTLAGNIAAITLIKNDIPADENCHKAGVIKSAINVLIEFKEEVQVDRLYKSPITTKRLLTSIDNPEEFKRAIAAACTAD